MEPGDDDDEQEQTQPCVSCWHCCKQQDLGYTSTVDLVMDLWRGYERFCIVCVQWVVHGVSS